MINVADTLKDFSDIITHVPEAQMDPYPRALARVKDGKASAEDVKAVLAGPMLDYERLKSHILDSLRYTAPERLSLNDDSTKPKDQG